METIITGKINSVDHKSYASIIAGLTRIAELRNLEFSESFLSSGHNMIAFEFEGEEFFDELWDTIAAELSDLCKEHGVSGDAEYEWEGAGDFTMLPISDDITISRDFAASLLDLLEQHHMDVMNVPDLYSKEHVTLTDEAVERFRQLVRGEE